MEMRTAFGFLAGAPWWRSIGATCAVYEEVRQRVTPKNHRAIARQYPRFMAALDALGEEAADAGPLSEKLRHLVQIAAAAAIRSEGAVHSHTRRALAAGATPEEVRHAVIAATSTIGFPNVMAALSWINDVTAKPGR